jgi:predicted secreted protein
MAEMSAKDYLSALFERANRDGAIKARLADWKQVFRWEVDGEVWHWKAGDGEIVLSEPGPAGFVLSSSLEVLKKVALRETPFFLALWATGEIRFEGSFSDAFRLGYLFLGDKRTRRVLFLAHCFLNMNTRFPEGADFEGANVPLVDLLLRSGVGIVQMPCPEFFCLGLEKSGWGVAPAEEIRGRFRGVAEGVADQVESYLGLGYEVAGIVGMNPSPSCGVERAKGKGTMLGVSRDTSEREEPGLFIEELQECFRERGMVSPPVFGVRRTLPGEGGLERELERVAGRLMRPSPGRG